MIRVKQIARWDYLSHFRILNDTRKLKMFKTKIVNRMFIGPCIVVIVEELKTNLMSLVIFISLIICSTCFGH